MMCSDDERPPSPLEKTAGFFGTVTERFAELVQLSRAATPHTMTGPALPNGAPFGPVM